MTRIITRSIVGVSVRLAVISILLTAGAVFDTAIAQSRIPYANREVFLSGVNIAWVNFADDLGATPPLSQLETEFRTVHESGGNVLKLWLHTNGANTPAFNDSGLVTGPGQYTIQDLKEILGLAQQYSVGVMLSLWSHDMLSTSELNSAELSRNSKLFTDTAYTMAYIRNALIPIVDSLKGNPAIQSYNIIVEPEGISDVLGWSGRVLVPIADIQRFINLTAGAIHREDNTALVTIDANTMQSNTDVQAPAGAQGVPLSVTSLSPAQQAKYTSDFNAIHRTDMSPAEWVAYMQKISLVGNYNYYTDARLKAAGSDSNGTLDFYTVDYYSGDGTAYSPFLHSYSAYGLDKPLVVGEFFMAPTDGLLDNDLYPRIYNNGYAGAMMWSWSEDPSKTSLTDGLNAIKFIFTNYRNDVIVFPKTGSIYTFDAIPGTIQKGDSAYIKWDVEPGSTVNFNGSPVSSVKDSVVMSPVSTTSYTLIATGEISDTSIVTLTVLPTGRIMSFKAIPIQIGTGESTTLSWQVVKHSTVTLNGEPVPVLDTATVFPDPSNNTYTLLTQGDEHDSMTIAIQVLAPSQVDRAFNAVVTASSNDTVAYPFSNPQNIVDGNNYTRWQAAATPTTQTVYLDMGRIVAMSQITIRWGNKAYAKQYSLRFSKDSVTWLAAKYVLNGSGGTNYVETISAIQDTGRYLQLQMLEQSTNGAYSVAEISVQGTLLTGVQAADRDIPTKYTLFQNFPNPFNPTTDLRFGIPTSGQVNLTVFNILGQKVEELFDGHLSAGNYEFRFDGSKLSSGVYYYILRTGGFVSSKKMMLIK